MTSAAVPAVETLGLVRTFGPRRALDAVSFRIEPGEIVGLLGPNGSGKSTLFRILSTLLSPTGGSACVFGLDVAREAAAVRRRIGVVFQNPSLDKKLSVFENLSYHGRLYGLVGTSLRDRVAALLARLRLTDRSRDRVETLSGGMARRVEIAKGLLHGPDLLLMDEPSTGLDPGARRDLWEHVGKRRDEEGVTVGFTTHLMEESERADRVVILDDGKVVAEGKPAELKSRIGGDVIRIETEQPEQLRQELVARFGGAASVVDGTVRLERQRGHEFVPQLVEAFPGRIAGVSVGKPTLEDVFIHVTGHRLTRENGGE